MRSKSASSSYLALSLLGVLVLLASFVLLGAPVVYAMTENAAIPAGYYLGHGDNARIAMKIMPLHQGKQQAIISGSHSSYTQAKSIIKEGLSHTGTITPTAQSNVYILTLQKMANYPVCQYKMTYSASSGVILKSMDKSCFHYHGFNWSYGTPVSQFALQHVSGLH